MDEYRFLHFPPDAVRVDERQFARLPASAQKIFGVLREQGPQTHADLREQTQMPARTIRYAVRRLKDEGLVDMRSSLKDCRTCYFFIDRSLINDDVIMQKRHEAERQAEVESLTLERV